MKKTLLSFVTMMAVFCMGAMAQVTTSSLGGHVLGEGGQALPGAVVKAVHTPTGTTYYTTSLTNGRFMIGGMRVGGPYVIEVEFLGYVTEKRNNVNLSLGEEATFNFQMKESSTSIGEVVVTGTNNPVFNPNRTGATEVITGDMMDRLPAQNRSLSDYTRLAPMSNGNNFGGISYRYNNVTVDGASFNNSFGLTDKLGAKGIEPISLEAIDQIQVMLSPFDVRQGGFTGGSVNSVTKSGTNQWSGSVYTYIKSPDLAGYNQTDSKGNKVEKTDFKNKQYGFSFSGPIIKNKLFFFVNGELDRQDEPNGSYRAKGLGGAESAAVASELADLQQFLITEMNYNPGSYDVLVRPSEGNRITARLDWNIDKKNTLSLKYYYLKSFSTNAPSTSGATGSRGPNQDAIPFSSAYYRTNNNFNIVMAELNTAINERMHNQLTVGFSAMRDFRDMDGGFFPAVDILSKTDPSNKTMTSFGTEPNSYNNMLNTDIWQLRDDFTFTTGKHQITAGLSADLRKFKNGFAQNYPGVWKFSTIDEFKFNALAMRDHLAAGGNLTNFVIGNYDPADYNLAPRPTDPTAAAAYGKPAYMRGRYSMGEGFPFAYVDVFNLSFYLQDKWSIKDNFHFTYGLRADIPIFLTDLPTTDRFDGVVFQGGRTVDVSKYPATRVQLSPRIGINWDVFNDRTLQVRGGAGLFAGTPPYVWLSNQAGNNGVLFGDLPNDNKAAGFTGKISDVRQWQIEQPTGLAVAKTDIAVTDEHFKYPTVFKGSIAADWDIWDGWILTGEFLYSKNINDIYHKNIGLNDPIAYVNDGSGTNSRPYFYTREYQAGKYTQFISDLTNNAILMTNTNRGHSAYATFKLQKSFLVGTLKGLSASGSYTFGKSTSVSDGSSSTANSAWTYRQAIDPNAEELGYSGASFPNRTLVMVSYRREYGKHFASSLGVIYERYTPFRYSYVYAGLNKEYTSVNGDNQTANDLIFIPATQDQINLKGADQAEKDAKWATLDAFIRQDPYLSKHRGEYAERNGAVVPSCNRIDLNFTQDFFVTTRSGDRNTIRLTLDIRNFGNMLNKNWGVLKTTALGSQASPQYQFLSLAENPSAANGYKATFDLVNNMPAKTFIDYVNPASRWSMMIGIKYMFN